MKIHFLNKIIDLHENDVDITGSIFKTKEELYKNKKLAKQLDYCFKNNIIRIQYIDHVNYDEFYEKHQNLIRPIKCYSYSYKIKPDFKIYHRCELQDISFMNFKPKPYYFCTRQCPCADDEREFRKELIVKG